MASLLLIGFLFGMRHALEADHVAAVASMVNGEHSLSQAMRQGGMWGLGHTLTLLLFGSAVIWLDTNIPENVAGWLEAMVGVMLIGLGLDVIRRLIKKRVHFHSHRHGDGGGRHIHAHSHTGEPRGQHQRSRHNHQHPKGLPIRALFVGLMHGMAGSAALIALALGTAHSPLQGMLYILLYGLGSILGMAMLSLVISVPIRLSARRLTWAHSNIQVALGVATCCLGMMIVYDNLPVG